MNQNTTRAKERANHFFLLGLFLGITALSLFLIAYLYQPPSATLFACSLGDSASCATLQTIATVKSDSFDGGLFLGALSFVLIVVTTIIKFSDNA